MSVHGSWIQPSAVVTELPSNPDDGEEIAFLADDANGIVWRLKYRADSASSYKWEFVGGLPMIERTESAGTGTTAIAWTNYGSGPIVNVPSGINGEFLMAVGGDLSPSAGCQMQCRPAVNGTHNLSGLRLINQQSSGYVTMYAEAIEELSAGDELRYQAYLMVGSTTSFVANRIISLLPVRLGP